MWKKKWSSDLYHDALCGRIPLYLRISVKLNVSDVVPQRTKKTDTMVLKDKFELYFGHYFDLSEWLKTLKDLTAELVNAL